MERNSEQTQGHHRFPQTTQKDCMSLLLEYVYYLARMWGGGYPAKSVVDVKVGNMQVATSEDRDMVLSTMKQTNQIVHHRSISRLHELRTFGDEWHRIGVEEVFIQYVVAQVCAGYIPTISLSELLYNALNATERQDYGLAYDLIETAMRIGMVDVCVEQGNYHETPCICRYEDGQVTPRHAIVAVIEDKLRAHRCPPQVINRYCTLLSNTIVCN